jgi:D-3-phosphoglycerate dehydrogenase
VRILVCDPIHEDGVNMLKEAGYDVELDTKITGEELVDKLGDYDAIIIRSRTNVDERVLRAKGKLKAVARAGVGLDNVDLETAKKVGIQVINSPEAPSNAVAELVLGLMLALARRIPEGDASLKRGEWIKRQLTGFELKGKTLGIIGFGRIGYELGKKCKALGMTVVAYDVAMDRVIKYVEEIRAESVTMEDLLSRSDFVSVHVPLLPQTRNLIGRDQIGLMKKSAYLINAARGGIIDEMALRDALVKGELGGAALDVFANEPPDDTSLTGLKNIICMPHIGAATVEAQRANSTIVAKKLIQIFS